MQNTTHRAGSIRENVRWAKKEGLNVSEVSIRRWVKTGQLKATYAGVKAIVVYQNLLDFLGVPDTNSTTEIRS